MVFFRIYLYIVHHPLFTYSSVVCVWVFEMVDKHRQVTRAIKEREEMASTTQLRHKTPEDVIVKPFETKREHATRKSTSDDNSSLQPSSSSDAASVALLKEIFPDASSEDMMDALGVSGGDLEQTIQRLLALGKKREKESEMKRKAEVRSGVRKKLSFVLWMGVVDHKCINILLSILSPLILVAMCV